MRFKNFLSSRRLFLIPALLTTTLALAVSAAVFALGNINGGGVDDGGVFEIDNTSTGADVIDEVAAGEDWQTLFDSCTLAGAGPKAGYSGAASVARCFSDPEGLTLFVQGSKDVLDIDEWRWANQNAPDKDEIVNAAAAKYGTTLYAMDDRLANNGDALMGFWFLQNAVCLKSDGTFGVQSGSACSGTATHTVGDVFMVSNFTNGGIESDIQAFKWQPGGTDAVNGVLVPLFPDAAGASFVCNSAVGSIPADAACASTNSVQTTALLPTFDDKGKTPAGQYAPVELVEVGLDLAPFGLGGSCFNTFLAETRSATSPTASQKDFVLGRFPTCGGITIIKDTVPDSTQPFSYTTTGGLTPSTFDLVDNPGSTNTQNYSDVLAGSYTVTEGAVTGYDLTSLVCVVSGPGTSASTDLGTRTASITLGENGSVTCTYTNTARATLIVVKNSIGGNDTFNYSTTGGNGLPAGFALVTTGADNTTSPLTPGTASQTFINLLPGAYTVTETGTTGWDPTSATCSASGGASCSTSGNTSGSATLVAGGTVTITFEDTKLFKLIIFTCDTVTETPVVSSVSLAGVATSSVSTVPTALANKGVTAQELCGLGGSSYDNLPSGSYGPSVTIP